jgi:ethanolamine transporter EutH
MEILYLAIGIMLGGFTAVMIMCMLIVSKNADQEEEEEPGRCPDLSRH